MTEKLSGFPPVANHDAKVLILGTMPGVKSLQQVEYYAHPHNAFWYIITRLFAADFSLSYEHKLSLLRQHKIALWDVLQTCHRQGSLDSQIKNAQANDLAGFIKKHPALVKVCFNGQKAAQLFKRYVGQSDFLHIEFETLPSTSPAMARLNKQQKYTVWKRALTDVLAKV